MSMHTPGPWGFCNAEHLVEHGDISISVVRDGSADGMLVAVVRDNNMREMQIANARLVAAAPDLLEACKAVADSPRGEGLQVEVICQLLEAIAKAEERSMEK